MTTSGYPSAKRSAAHPQSPPRDNRARTLLTRAVTFFKTGEFQKADAVCGILLARDPGHADGLHLRGLVAWQIGRHVDAIEWLQRAIAGNPAHPWYHHHLAGMLLDQGRLAEAEASANAALSLRPAFPEARLTLGMVLQKRGRLDEAIQAYRAAIALRDDDPQAHSNLGTVLFARGAYAEAEACHRRALAIRPTYAEAYCNLGNVASALGRIDEALAAYRQAITLAPELAEAYGNVGTVLYDHGRAEESHRMFEEAIRRAPTCGAFHRMLALSGRIRPGDPAALRMEQLLAGRPDLGEIDRMEIHFGLGRVYEQDGRAAEAMQHFGIANQIKRAWTAYDEATTLAALRRIREVFTPALVGNLGGGQIAAAGLPIFVVGMPRSGTSLIEQILASYPAVAGSGEAMTLPQLAVPLGTNDALTREGLDQLGRDYVAAQRTLAPEAIRIVDKQWENFMRVGLIHLALPQARVIHVRRDPVATCLSCYSILFTGALNFSYDLGELGRYYRAYQAVMQHWHETLPPGVICEVEYERLIEDPETEVRRMLDHCGLPWDPRCLDFHLNERAVRTASTLLVRQKLYRHSLDRWRAFEEHSGPLLQALLAPAEGQHPMTRISWCVGEGPSVWHRALG